MLKEKPMSKNTKKYDWYEIHIEEPLKEIVKELCNNGINTCSSCGHGRWIQAETLDPTEDLRTIYNVLTELGETDYRAMVFAELSEAGYLTFIEITLPDQSGEYYNEITDNTAYMQYETKTKTNYSARQAKDVAGSVSIGAVGIGEVSNDATSTKLDKLLKQTANHME